MVYLSSELTFPVKLYWERWNRRETDPTRCGENANARYGAHRAPRPFPSTRDEGTLASANGCNYFRVRPVFRDAGATS